MPPIFPMCTGYHPKPVTSLTFQSLLFFVFLAFSVLRFSLLSCAFFALLSKDFKGSAERKILAFFQGILAFFPKKGWIGGSGIKASQPYFLHFPRCRFRIFRVCSVESPRPLFFWGESDLPHFPRIGFESLISKIRPTGFIVTGLS